MVSCYPACITRMLRFCFYFILFLFLIPFNLVSTFQFPHLNNASDQEALLAFMSALTPEYDPLPTTWQPDVSFCEWTGVICTRRRQRVVSLNVSSMGLQGSERPLLQQFNDAEEGQKDEKKDEGCPVTFSYSFFHLILPLASMYSAVFVTGWTCPTKETEELIDVDWPYVWV